MVLLLLLWLAFSVTLNPPGQYADDRHLRARQRFWLYQDPQFDIVNWVLDLAGPSPGMRVLDAGCGNGLYLRGLADRGVTAVGCDLSPGMLRAAAAQAAVHPAVLNADVTALPLGDGAVDVALAIHMLYHVPDRPAALRELRRVTAPGGVFVAVTNGARHTRALRDLIERAAGDQNPGWRMRPATHAFTAENAADQLGAAFETVTLVRPDQEPPVVIRDAAVAAGYVASLGTHHDDETTRPWADVVADVRRQVQAVIDEQGAFVTYGDLVAFRCQ
jgi:SAM-dependent methyltransferase